MMTTKSACNSRATSLDNKLRDFGNKETGKHEADIICDDNQLEKYYGSNQIFDKPSNLNTNLNFIIPSSNGQIDEANRYKNRTSEVLNLTRRYFYLNQYSIYNDNCHDCEWPTTAKAAGSNLSSSSNLRSEQSNCVIDEIIKEEEITSLKTASSDLNDYPIDENQHQHRHQHHQQHHQHLQQHQQQQRQQPQHQQSSRLTNFDFNLVISSLQSSRRCNNSSDPSSSFTSYESVLTLEEPNSGNERRELNYETRVTSCSCSCCCCCRRRSSSCLLKNDEQERDYEQEFIYQADNQNPSLGDASRVDAGCVVVATTSDNSVLANVLTDQDSILSSSSPQSCCFCNRTNSYKILEGPKVEHTCHSGGNQKVASKSTGKNKYPNKNLQSTKLNPIHSNHHNPTPAPRQRNLIYNCSNSVSTSTSASALTPVTVSGSASASASASISPQITKERITNRISLEDQLRRLLSLELSKDNWEEREPLDNSNSLQDKQAKRHSQGDKILLDSSSGSGGVCASRVADINSSEMKRGSAYDKSSSYNNTRQQYSNDPRSSSSRQMSPDERFMIFMLASKSTHTNSTVERNARILKWLNNCKSAT